MEEEETQEEEEKQEEEEEEAVALTRKLLSKEGHHSLWLKLSFRLFPKDWNRAHLFILDIQQRERKGERV